MIGTALAILGAFLTSLVMGLAAGAIADEIESRRYLVPSGVIPGAVGVLVFTASLVAGIAVLT